MILENGFGCCIYEYLSNDNENVFLFAFRKTIWNLVLQEKTKLENQIELIFGLVNLHCYFGRKIGKGC